MPDGREPEPGGWNRFQIEVDDLDGLVERLRAGGSRFATRSWLARRSPDPCRRPVRQPGRAVRAGSRMRAFLRGAVQLHVLHHAAEEEIDGAWMSRELAHHGHQISAGTLYPTLHRMEEEGLLISRESPSREAGGASTRPQLKAGGCSRDPPRAARAGRRGPRLSEEPRAGALAGSRQPP